MSEELNKCINDTKAHMDKSIEHLKNELVKVRAGKANPGILEGVMAEAYGAMTPVNQLGNVSTPDGKTIMIQPWDKSLLQAIEKGIMASNIGLNPQNDGEIIRMFLPPLTEERRKDLVKQVKAYAEQAKVSVRNIRRDANESVKKLQKDGLAEDLAKGGEEKIQKMTNDYIAGIDKIVEVKEKEIMTV
ncbi:MAG: ribosome recycling factor [Bacteroidota bacterium]